MNVELIVEFAIASTIFYVQGLDDDMQVDPSDVTQSSGDWPYKAGVYPN